MLLTLFLTWLFSFFSSKLVGQDFIVLFHSVAWKVISNKLLFLQSETEIRAVYHVPSEKKFFNLKCSEDWNFSFSMHNVLTCFYSDVTVEGGGKRLVFLSALVLIVTHLPILCYDGVRTCCLWQDTKMRQKVVSRVFKTCFSVGNFKLMVIEGISLHSLPKATWVCSRKQILTHSTKLG